MTEAILAESTDYAVLVNRSSFPTHSYAENILLPKNQALRTLVRHSCPYFRS